METFSDRVKRLANEAIRPRSKSEQLFGVDGDVAAMRVMLSSEPEQVKAAACSLLLRWSKRVTDS
jgi:hypothetical protein